MGKLLFIALLLLIGASLCSCATDTVVSQPTGSLSFKSNVVEWLCPEDASMLFTKHDTVRSFRLIAFSSKKSPPSELELFLGNLKDTGTFFLHGADSIFINSFYEDFSYNSVDFNGITDANSFIRITQIDTSLINFDPDRSPSGLKFINLEGSFALKTIGSSNFADTVLITEGKFDLVCNPYPRLP